MTHHHTQLQPGETPLMEKAARSIQRHKVQSEQRGVGTAGPGEAREGDREETVSQY